jgi:hypothetical protein
MTKSKVIDINNIFDNPLTVDSEGGFFLRLLDNSQEPEQEKAPARIFLKIGA